MVELKSPHLFRRHDVPRRTVGLLGDGDVVLSFERRALLEARAARPEIRRLQHVGYGTSIRTAASYAWGVGFHDPRVTRRGLRRAKQDGLVTTVYTVNETARMLDLERLGVDGIFTDRPDRARAVLTRPRG